MVTFQAATSLEKRRKQTNRIIAKYLDRLPVLPNVVASIVASGDKKNLADKIEKLANLDPTLALRICYLARRLKPDFPVAIGADLTLVGSDAILDGLRKLETRSVFHPQRAHERELWLHSIQVALISRHIAHTNPSFGIGTDEAYFYGLLHDIGRFVMLVADPEAYARLETEDWETGEQLVQKEREITGYDHGELGALAATTWHLPPLLATVIKYHHRIDHGHTLDAKAKNLIDMIRLADNISFVMVKHPEVINETMGIQQFMLGKGRAMATVRTLPLDFDGICRAAAELMTKSSFLMNDLMT